MPTTFINPFDLRKLLVEYFIGDGQLFAFVFIIIYSYMAARFGFTNKIYYFLLVIGSIIMGVYLGEAWYILILILFGAASFKTISRWVA